ncbi:hypothetical protein F5Y19DRAFT_488221 [Xylariaceae sp. FL1651]|nr:hypothetical protein F5Y19DRAFT_488221 [Xylariaceae sp. FL1651]
MYYFHIRFTAAVLAIFHVANASPVLRDGMTISTRGQPRCRYLPGDTAWPNQSAWNKLNQTVGGRLIRGTPLGQTCYGSDLTASAQTQCAKLQSEWTFLEPFLDDPVNVMSPYWMNKSCSPFDGPGGSCSLGNLPSFAINVSSADDMIAGVKFAQNNNIRIVIKNTGHDFLGRSSGEGALSLWTHNLKETTFINNYRSPSYKGPAMRIGAGITNIEMYTASHAKGYRTVGGSCPTVGAGGGYTQGGGHGPLGGKYGLGADQVLEYELVTAEGTHVTASPSSKDYADLYWAVAGGGAGNYAVIVSMTVKAYKDGPIAGAGFAFANTGGPNYWQAISAWLKHLLVLNEIEGFGTLWAFTALGFQLEYATLPDRSAADISAALAPFFAEVAALNVTVTNRVANQHADFLAHYGAWATQVYDTNNSVGGRLIPRATVQDDLPALVAAFADIAVNSSDVGGCAISGISANVSHARVGNGAGANSVLPAWRDALFTMTIGIPLTQDAGWAEMSRGQAQLNAWQDKLRAVTPGGGTYINEATYDNVNWKTDYYGPNYNKLLGIKNKYDPNHLFWSNAAVGSDLYWKLAGDGRLCRV